MYALQQVAGELTALRQTLHHLVQDGGLALAVDAREDVHVAVKVPNHMLPPAPQRVDFYLRDVFCIFCHRLIGFVSSFKFLSF